MILVEKQKEIISISVAISIGAIIFFIIYSELLNPFYDAWLLTGGPDLVQHYIGWLMYSKADWSFPLGLANNYAYPLATPITYTDSIPLFAIFFKLLTSFFPSTFQYTGLWILTCFVLQSVFAYLLLKIFIFRRFLALIGSIFFTLSPIMLFRLGGHFALGGHWLILAGIWLIFRPHQNINYWLWSSLLVLSLLVHPYLLFMSIFLLLVDIINLLIVKKLVNFKRALIFLVLEIILLLIIAHALGLFVISEATADGYGDFSMNLNALINPLSWSRVIPDFSIIRYQSEGFNYLGLGLIFLLLLSVYKFLYKKRFKYFWKNFWPLIIISIILLSIAISNTVAFNSYILWSIDLPGNISNDIFGFFRASGRFFWPVYYLIFLAAFYIIRKLEFKKASLLLLVALSFQVYDLSDKLNDRGREFEDKKWDNVFISSGLDVGDNNYKHIIFLPVIPHRNFPAFAVYAAENNLTINDGYFARPVKGLDEYRNQKIRELQQGKVDENTIYVFSREADNLMANLDLENHLIKEVDATVVLFSYFKK